MFGESRAPNDHNRRRFPESFSLPNASLPPNLRLDSSLQRLHNATQFTTIHLIPSDPRSSKQLVRRMSIVCVVPLPFQVLRHYRTALSVVPDINLTISPSPTLTCVLVFLPLVSQPKTTTLSGLPIAENAHCRCNQESRVPPPSRHQATRFWEQTSMCVNPPPTPSRRAEPILF